jgi:hypothetical protein
MVSRQAIILAYADASLAKAVASFIAIFLVMLLPKVRRGRAAGRGKI